VTGAFFSDRRFGAGDTLVPLALTILVGLWLSAAMRPLLVDAIAASLPPGADARVAQIVDSALRFRALGVAIVPAVQICVIALRAFLVLGALLEPPRFGVLTACAAWALLALTLKSVVRCAVLVLGNRPLAGVEDLEPGVGLGFLAAEKPSVAYDVLELANLFDVMFVAILALTIARAAKVPTARATLAAIIPWLLMNAVRISFNVLFT
jgi:hypothetical protein